MSPSPDTGLMAQGHHVEAWSDERADQEACGDGGVEAAGGARLPRGLEETDMKKRETRRPPARAGARRNGPRRDGRSVAGAVLSLALMATRVDGVAAQAAVVATRPAESIERAVALATFDSAWTRIRDTHYDTTFRGVNWAGVGAELRPRAASAGTLSELRQVLREMLARLGESHYSLIPFEVADGMEARRAQSDPDGIAGDVGLDVRLAGDALIVWRVREGGPAARAGVEAGWYVEAVEEEELAGAVEGVSSLPDGATRRAAVTQLLWSLRGRLEGPAGSMATVRFRDGRGAVVSRDLLRTVRPGEPIRFGNLPTFLAELEHERIETDGGCVGVIRFNIWMVPLVAEFDRAMDVVRACQGVIIDLRGNPGGIAGMVMGVSGHFLDERVALGTMHSRGTSLNFVANPRRVDTRGNAVVPYAGPLAILVDNLSVSTSEFFAGGMQALGRARVFGERTAGQALPATLLRLPSGDVLMYVVADFTAPDGSRIEGRGVIPDEVVPLERAALLAGRDGAEAAALAWLAGQSATGRN